MQLLWWHTQYLFQLTHQDLRNTKQGEQYHGCSCPQTPSNQDTTCGATEGSEHGSGKEENEIQSISPSLFQCDEDPHKAQEKN